MHSLALKGEAPPRASLLARKGAHFAARAQRVGADGGATVDANGEEVDVIDEEEFLWLNQLKASGAFVAFHRSCVRLACTHVACSTLCDDFDGLVTIVCGLRVLG
eukprot:4875198-Pleurochrysis_carterae.AAC.2